MHSIIYIVLLWLIMNNFWNILLVFHINHVCHSKGLIASITIGRSCYLPGGLTKGNCGWPWLVATCSLILHIICLSTDLVNISTHFRVMTSSKYLYIYFTNSVQWWISVHQLCAPQEPMACLGFWGSYMSQPLLMSQWYHTLMLS